MPVTEPLGDADKAEPDKGLVGKWKDGAEEVEIDIPVVKGHPKGLMRAVSNGRADDENAFWFFATAVGKHTYATVYLAPGSGLKFADFRKEGEFEKYPTGKDRRYFIFKYTLADDLGVEGGKGSAVDGLMEAAKIGRTDVGYYQTPAGWLAKYLEKDGPDKVYDGSNGRKFGRVKK